MNASRRAPAVSASNDQLWGWASTTDELEVGLTGVAVPVHGGRGELVAALGISGPTPRMEGRLDELGRQLLEHAAQLSTLLGRTRKEGVA